MLDWEEVREIGLAALVDRFDIMGDGVFSSEDQEEVIPLWLVINY